MYWAFKTTLKLVDVNGKVQRLLYVVSAANDTEAKSEIERRFQEHEIYAYTVETIVAATQTEAALLNLPAGCVQLLGV